VASPEVSPELVLVWPELAEAARATLPDRPWERFVPALPPQIPIPGPRGVTAPPRSRIGRAVTTAPLVVLAAFVAVVVVGSFPGFGKQPKLEPRPAPTSIRPARDNVSLGTRPVASTLQQSAVASRTLSVRTRGR
jgi:hypothetical protein